MQALNAAYLEPLLLSVIALRDQVSIVDCLVKQFCAKAVWVPKAFLIIATSLHYAALPEVVVLITWHSPKCGYELAL